MTALRSNPFEILCGLGFLALVIRGAVLIFGGGL